MRFRAENEQTWGIQLIREISRNNEESWFAFTAKRERSGVPRYAHLAGLSALQPSSPFELLPYGLTRATYNTVPRESDVPFANPFRDGSDFTTSIGLDLKYRLASNLTLDATFNPDFGQIEADPATINLSAFETRFDERRPFFIEGSDIFDFGEGAEIFYSRRIGAPPPGRMPAEAVYDDMPENSTILGAAKLTGKVAGWSLGIAEAVTGRERADYITEDESRGSAVVAPLSNYFATRARREMRDGESVVGGIFTAVHRDLSVAALANRVRGSAYTGGVDFTHAWADRSWSVNGFLVGSHIAGRAGVITAAQHSSARYFHRPDAVHLNVDSAARTMTGFSGGIELSKESGLHWRGRAGYETTSPGFEINDFGFQSRADQHSAEVSVEYVEERPGRLFREWEYRNHAAMAAGTTAATVSAPSSASTSVVCCSTTGAARCLLRATSVRWTTGSRAAARSRVIPASAATSPASSPTRANRGRSSFPPTTSAALWAAAHLWSWSLASNPRRTGTFRCHAEWSQRAGQCAVHRRHR